MKEEAPKGQPRLSRSRLNELVEEALVDAYGESELATAFYTMKRMIFTFLSKRRSWE